MEHYREAVKSGQLCMSIEDIREHFYSVYSDTKGNNRQPCEVCREKTIWRCGLCKKPMCTRRRKGWNGVKCIFQYHNHDFFALSRSDHSRMHGQDLKTWVKPTDYVVSRNARKIERWKKDFLGEGEGDEVVLGNTVSISTAYLHYHYVC